MVKREKDRALKIIESKKKKEREKRKRKKKSDFQNYAIYIVLFKQLVVK